MKKTIFYIALLLATYTGAAQVGIGTNNPDGSAALEIQSTTKGLLLPRLTLAQISTITNPAEGLMVYCTNCPEKGLYIFNGTDFLKLTLGISIQSNLILQQIGNEANTGIPSVVTIAQLKKILPPLRNIDAGREGAYRADIDYHPHLFSNPATAAEVQAMIERVRGFSTVTGAGGKIWMDRNVGASEVATSNTSYYAYGGLFQWGRSADGHQAVVWTSGTSGILNTLSSITSSSDTPGHNNFIRNKNYPFDWRVPQNHNLWQGVNGTNNPCPSGFRVPTKAEWETEMASWSSQDATGAFNSPLKLPMPGSRNSVSGSFSSTGSMGSYWTSTVVSGSGPINAEFVEAVSFNSNSASIVHSTRASGLSVRCIKD